VTTPVQTTATLLRAEAVTRSFGRGATQVRALRGIDLEAGAGRLVAVRGRSGSGKTTLLNVLGGLDQPTTGTVSIDGTDLATQQPELLIADEPTGHLDSHTGMRILQLLRQIADIEGTAVVVSTHDRRLTEFADTVLDLHDGQIVR
jgi:ABC-type lipoprotein export system ATPase subunit